MSAVLCLFRLNALGTWTTTGSLSVARGYHTATLLGNGMVLVAGGANAWAQCELYDPSTGATVPQFCWFSLVDVVAL